MVEEEPPQASFQDLQLRVALVVPVLDHQRPALELVVEAPYLVALDALDIPPEPFLVARVDLVPDVQPYRDVVEPSAPLPDVVDVVAYAEVLSEAYDEVVLRVRVQEHLADPEVVHSYVLGVGMAVDHEDWAVASRAAVEVLASTYVVRVVVLAAGVHDGQGLAYVAVPDFDQDGAEELLAGKDCEAKVMVQGFGMVLAAEALGYFVAWG